MITDGPAPHNIYEFEGFRPVIHESAFIHPNATVTGNVIIGRDVYVGPGASPVAVQPRRHCGAGPRSSRS